MATTDSLLFDFTNNTSKDISLSLSVKHQTTEFIVGDSQVCIPGARAETAEEPGGIAGVSTLAISLSRSIIDPVLFEAPEGPDTHSLGTFIDSLKHKSGDTLLPSGTDSIDAMVDAPLPLVTHHAQPGSLEQPAMISQSATSSGVESTQLMDIDSKKGFDSGQSVEVSVTATECAVSFTTTPACIYNCIPPNIKSISDTTNLGSTLHRDQNSSVDVKDISLGSTQFLNKNDKSSISREDCNNQYDDIFGSDSDLSSVDGSIFGPESPIPVSPTHSLGKLEDIFTGDAPDFSLKGRGHQGRAQKLSSKLRKSQKSPYLPKSTRISVPTSALVKRSIGSKGHSITSRKNHNTIKPHTLAAVHGLPSDLVSKMDSLNTPQNYDDASPNLAPYRKRRLKKLSLDLEVEDGSPGPKICESPNACVTIENPPSSTAPISTRRPRSLRSVGQPSNVAPPINPFREQEIHPCRSTDEDMALLRQTHFVSPSVGQSSSLSAIDISNEQAEKLVGTATVGSTSNSDGTALSARSKRSLQALAHGTTIPTSAAASTSGAARRNFVKVRNSHDNCSACLGPGELLCCDTCPRVFHLSCIAEGFSEADVPPGFWQCQRCAFLISESAATSAYSLSEVSSRNSSLEPMESSFSLYQDNIFGTMAEEVSRRKDQEFLKKRKREDLFDPIMKILDSMTPRVFELPTQFFNMYEDVLAHPAHGGFIDLRTTKVEVIPSSGRNFRGQSRAGTSLCGRTPVMPNATVASKSIPIATQPLTADTPSIIPSVGNPDETTTTVIDQLSPHNTATIPQLHSHSFNEESSCHAMRPCCHGCGKTNMRISQTSFMSSYTVTQPRRSGTNHLNLQSQRSELIQCDYCTLSWHLDCLLPPLATIPPELRPSSKEIVDPAEWQRIKSAVWMGSPLNDLCSMTVLDTPSLSGHHSDESSSSTYKERHLNPPRQPEFFNTVMAALDPGLLDGSKHLSIRKKWMCPCHADWVLPKRRRRTSRTKVHVPDSTERSSGLNAASDPSGNIDDGMSPISLLPAKHPLSFDMSVNNRSAAKRVERANSIKTPLLVPSQREADITPTLNELHLPIINPSDTQLHILPPSTNTPFSTHSALPIPHTIPNDSDEAVSSDIPRFLDMNTEDDISHPRPSAAAKGVYILNSDLGRYAASTSTEYTNLGHILIDNTTATDELFRSIYTARCANDVDTLDLLLGVNYQISESRIASDFLACIRKSTRTKKFKLVAGVGRDGVVGDQVVLCDKVLQHKFAEYDQTFFTDARRVYNDSRRTTSLNSNMGAIGKTTDRLHVLSHDRHGVVGSVTTKNAAHTDGRDLKPSVVDASEIRDWLGSIPHGLDEASEDFLAAMALLQMDLTKTFK
ncbi:hypothetical protein BSLG_002178 [Batrachochytrium salamandrivorans]|nr:hypothetical protein BSLG_002178 [Batrachochytrium salamandrivorans]